MLWLSDRKEYKILLAIKQRYKKYWKIWISRLEYNRFWLSERKMNEVIKLLKSKWLILFYKSVKWNNNAYKCNQYTISEEFKSLLDGVVEFTKKVFTYIQYTPDDVINYISQFSQLKKKQWKFTINWSKYIVADSWKWRWKIFSVEENRIISLITLQNAR
jgi:hypothetical protein